MVGLVDSWCFCYGGGKSEKIKATIFTSKGSAMAHIASTGTGFLIHRNLLLTTHVILPSVAAAEAAEIRLQNGVVACLFPHRLLFLLIDFYLCNVFIFCFIEWKLIHMVDYN